MGDIRLIALDILKPHEPSIIELASSISDLEEVEGVDVSVYEIDSKVENVKVTILGTRINFDVVKKTIEELGATVHSIDKVSSGKKLIEEVRTHQDK